MLCDAPRALSMKRAKLAPGMKVGQYVIRRLMAEGGFGEVYLAEHPLLGRRAAIKVLFDSPEDPQGGQRLLAEARAVNAARHPNVVDVFDFGALADGRPYMAMDYLEGQTLLDLLDAGPLEATHAVTLIDQICAALEAAHNVGVIHRDLKPSNIFITKTAQGDLVKVLDFGIAKQAPKPNGTAAPTAVGRITGTPDFMSPEQCLSAPVSPRSDLYSLGVVAFQMLTGQLPFTGDIEQVLRQHVEAAPPKPSSLHAMPLWLEAIVLRLLEKRPHRRPASAAEVRTLLALRGREPKAPAPAARVADSTIPARPRSVVEGSTTLRAAHDDHQIPTDPVGRESPNFVREGAAPTRDAERTPQSTPGDTVVHTEPFRATQDVTPKNEPAPQPTSATVTTAPVDLPLPDEPVSALPTIAARGRVTLWPWVLLAGLLVLGGSLWMMVRAG